MSEKAVDPRRLIWAGPLTTLSATVAVDLLRRVCVAFVPPRDRFTLSILNSLEPAIATAVCVSAGVGVFAILGQTSTTPIRTFTRIAAGTLIASFIPNVAVTWAVPEVSWAGMLSLMLMHLTAWALAVAILPRAASKS